MTIHARTTALGWSASVTAEHPPQRPRRRNLEIDDPSCAALRDAVVLVSSLLLDDLWAEGRTIHPPVAVRAERPLDRPPATGRSGRWTALSSLFGTLSGADLPALATGVRLRAAFDAPAPIGLYLDAQVWPHDRARDESGAGGKFSAYEGALGACARALQRDRVVLVVCSGARGGVTHAQGIGLAGTQGETRPRLLVDVGTGVRVRLGGPMWMTVELLLSLPLLRDRFTYLDAAGTVVEIHRAWPVVPGFALGIGARSTLSPQR